MNEIVLNSSVMPVVSSCDYIAAAEPFFHADRVADFHVLIYVTKGVIYVTEENSDGETDYAVEAGELLFLKSGVRHYGKTEIPKGTEWYFIHFSCNTEQSLPLFRPNASPLPQYTVMKSALALPKYITDTSGKAERALAELCSYCQGDDKFKQWRINSMLFSLLSELSLEQFSLHSAPTLSDKICAYLSEHASQPFSAKEISSTFYLSYKRLAAVFKAEKGVTMQQYHTTLRLNEACRLLRSTLLSVGEIAAAVGFTDVLYFSRCFRANIGSSPTEYRRAAKNY